MLSGPSEVGRIGPRIVADGRDGDLSAANDLAAVLDARGSASFVESVMRRIAAIERELGPHSP
jgi:hypothetical protein